MYQYHKCQVVMINQLYYYDHQLLEVMYQQIMNDVDNVMLVVYYFVMVLSSNLNDHHDVFLIPMYHWEEFDLIHDHQKSPSYLMLFLFDKYLHYDILLLVVIVMVEY